MSTKTISEAATAVLQTARDLCDAAFNECGRHPTESVTVEEVITPDVHLSKDVYALLRDELLGDDIKLKRREATLAECKAHGTDAKYKRFFYSLVILPGAIRAIGCAE